MRLAKPAASLETSTVKMREDDETDDKTGRIFNKEKWTTV